MLPPPRARIRDGSACFEKAPWSYLSVLYREMCRLWVSVLSIRFRRGRGTASERAEKQAASLLRRALAIEALLGWPLECL